jgi:hypothetical protein
MISEALVGLVSERFWMLRLIHLTDDLRPHRLRDNRTHRLTDLAQLDLQREDVGAPLTPVEDGLQLPGAMSCRAHHGYDDDRDVILGTNNLGGNPPRVEP